MRHLLIAALLVLFVMGYCCGQVGTQFGFLVADIATAPAKATVIKRQLFNNCVRTNIIMQAWTGSNAAVQTYLDSGLKVILNINGSGLDPSGNPTPWPSPATAAAATTSILTAYHPELAVIENEENNIQYHSGTDQEYIDELAICLRAAHLRGVKVTNAGLTDNMVRCWMWWQYIQAGNFFQADAWKTKYTDPLGLHTDGAYFISNYTRCEYFLSHYDTMAIDYVNIHFYATANDDLNPHVFNQINDVIYAKTGKKVISNEFGVRTPDIVVAKKMFVNMRKAAYQYAIFYSGDSVTMPSYGVLAASTGTALNARGKLISNYLLKMKSETNYRVNYLQADNTFALDNYEVDAISNDTTLSALSPKALVTEFAVGKAVRSATPVLLDTTLEELNGGILSISIPHHLSKAPRYVSVNCDDGEGLIDARVSADDTNVIISWPTGPICECTFTGLITP